MLFPEPIEFALAAYPSKQSRAIIFVPEVLQFRERCLDSKDLDVNLRPSAQRKGLQWLPIEILIQIFYSLMRFRIDRSGFLTIENLKDTMGFALSSKATLYAAMATTKAGKPIIKISEPRPFNCNMDILWNLRKFLPRLATYCDFCRRFYLKGGFHSQIEYFSVETLLGGEICCPGVAFDMRDDEWRELTVAQRLDNGALKLTNLDAVDYYTITPEAQEDRSAMSLLGMAMVEDWVSDDDMSEIIRLFAETKRSSEGT
ncbi:MAG: hypothetical protein Q9227_006871 [Pyrenula ochraceoflavens]